VAVILLGVSLSAAYVGSLSTWFRWTAVALLVAGLAYALTAWPTGRG
jgi:hypothetical protein